MRMVKTGGFVLVVVLLLSTTQGLNYNFKKGIDAAVEQLNLIFQRYELYDAGMSQFVLGVSNMNSNTWDILKAKLVTKILSGEADEDDDTSTFFMIFGGSSVTAGHDNFYNLSWPFVAERRMEPALRALGVRLLVHNIAQGANQCLPSNWCYKSMGGQFLRDRVPEEAKDAAGVHSSVFRKADVLGWEQSFNCGREQKIFELMARVAADDDALLYLAASGSFENPSKCHKSQAVVPRIFESWHPDSDPDILLAKANEAIKQVHRGDESSTSATKCDRGVGASTAESTSGPPKILRGAAPSGQRPVYCPYEPDHATVLGYKALTHQWNVKANSVLKFAGPLLDANYKKVGAHGLNFWAQSKAICQHPVTKAACDPVDLLGVCAEAGGPKWMTPEVGLYFPAGYIHSHHPSTGQHLIRGELLAYNYLHVLLDAVYSIQSEMEGTSGQGALTAKDVYSKYLRLLQESQARPIPEKPVVLPVHEGSTPPVCYTNFEPHYNSKMRLQDIVVGNADGWVYNDGRDSAPFGSSSHGVAHGYKDYRPSYQTSQKEAAISLEFNLNNGDTIYICGYKHKEAFKFADFFVDLDVPYFPDERARKAYQRTVSLTHRPPVLWERRHHIGGDTECTRLYEMPTGHHVLTVKAKAPQKNPNSIDSGSRERHHIAITHLITF